MREILEAYPGAQQALLQRSSGEPTFRQEATNALDAAWCYLLLQIHTKMLNDNLESTFRQWPLRSGGLPFAGSRVRLSDLERQLFTSRMHLQRVALLDYRSQEPLGQRILRYFSTARRIGRAP
jgi:hypothetical protein